MVSEERKLYTDEYGRMKHGLDHKNNFQRQKLWEDFIFLQKCRRSQWKGFKNGGYMLARSGLSKVLANNAQAERVVLHSFG